MHRRRRTLVEHVSRSLTVAGIAWAVVFLYVAPPALLADIGSPPRDGNSALSPTRSHLAWTDEHARRYPRCVAVAAWSTTRRPTAVVVLRRNGDLQRMALGEALRRAQSASAADDVWTIGACR
jgi:hypothetical protein